MPSTWNPLANVTLASDQASVILLVPTTYRDLRIVVRAVSSVEMNVGIQLNGDVGNNYNQVNMRGFSTSSTASSTSNGNAIYSNYSTGAVTGSVVVNTYDLLDYSQTDKHKHILIRANHGGEVDAIAGRWASTAAITSATIISGSTFGAGSTFEVFGIAG